jgi:hypothetical protein
MMKPQGLCWWAVKIGSAIVIVGITFFVLPFLIDQGPIKEQPITHLQIVVGDIPVPDKAILIAERMYGCTKCEFAELVALYTTDLSPKNICAFYHGFVQTTQWTFDGQWNCDGAEPIQLYAHWPFGATDSREQTFYFGAYSSNMVPLSWFVPMIAIRKAKEMGEPTIYRIHVSYAQNGNLKRECGDSHCADWWDIHNP